MGEEKQIEESADLQLGQEEKTIDPQEMRKEWCCCYLSRNLWLVHKQWNELKLMNIFINV
jgi:hypothetical protein